jgi:predicted secreted protein
MAHYSGRAGEVDTGSSVTGVKSWTLDYTVSVLDTTDFADAGVRSILPGVSQWSGSFEGYKDGTAQVLGTSSSVTLSLKETQTASQKWTGSAYITGVHATTAFDGTVNYSYDFEGTGALTVPTG